MVEDTEEARQNTDKYPRPLNVIEGPLMKVCACVCVWMGVCRCDCGVCGGGARGVGYMLQHLLAVCLTCVHIPRRE